MSIVQYTTEKPDKQLIATKQMRTNLFPTKRAMLIFTAFSIILIASCERNEKFEYPTSKYWAHCVSNVDLGRKTAPLFEGLEVDMSFHNLPIVQSMCKFAHSDRLRQIM